MSIEDKALFLKGLEDELSKEIPIAQMHRILCAVSGEMEKFEMQRIVGEEDSEDDLLSAYISAMRIQGLSKKTIERYSYLIKRMMGVVKTPLRKINVFHLRSYFSHEKERGLSDRTLEGERQVFNAFFNWLSREGLIENNPAANIGPIKYQKKLKSIYSDIEIETLKAACRSVRDLAIIMFLYTTGCRISEMTNLNRDDINLSSLECNVLGKENKERTVYISAYTARIIGEYLSGRTDDGEALFVGRGTNRLSPAGVRKLLNNVADRAHLNNVHPHKFRRTLATNLIRHGMPIQEVAHILGHEKIDTTMQYVVLDKSEVRNSYRKYA